MMTHDEIKDYEHGIFWPALELFEKQLTALNIALADMGKEIYIQVSNDYSLNAHAIKRADKKYLINIRSGIIPLTFGIIAENVDFFLEKYPDLEDKETSVMLGTLLVWTQIFGHELGHILRGHLDVVNNNITNLVDDESALSIIHSTKGTSLELDYARMIMEFDADIFSAFFVANRVLSMIKNAPEKSIKEETLISLALTSIFFFFNELCKIEGKSTKYPPSMVRANALNMHLVKHLSGKTSFSDEELSEIMRHSIFDTYSFLVDKGAFNQGMDSVSLDSLDKIETNLLNMHRVFEDLMTDNIILKESSNKHS